MTGSALAAIEGDLLMFLMSHASWKVTARGENMIRLPQAAQSFHKDKIFKIFLRFCANLSKRPAYSLERCRDDKTGDRRYRYA